jgi:hypothetical protein
VHGARPRAGTSVEPRANLASPLVRAMPPQPGRSCTTAARGRTPSRAVHADGSSNGESRVALLWAETHPDSRQFRTRTKCSHTRIGQLARIASAPDADRERRARPLTCSGPRPKSLAALAARVTHARSPVGVCSRPAELGSRCSGTASDRGFGAGQPGRACGDVVAGGWTAARGPIRTGVHLRETALFGGWPSLLPGAATRRRPRRTGPPRAPPSGDRPLRKQRPRPGTLPAGRSSAGCWCSR